MLQLHNMAFDCPSSTDFPRVLCQDHSALGLNPCPSEASSLSISIPAITLSPGISSYGRKSHQTTKQTRLLFSALHLRVTKKKTEISGFDEFRTFHNGDSWCQHGTHESEKAEHYLLKAATLNGIQAKQMQSALTSDYWSIQWHYHNFLSCPWTSPFLK